MQHSIFQTTLGIIEIKATDEHIKSVRFASTLENAGRGIEIPEIKIPLIKESGHPLIKECTRQLMEYFDGQRMEFDLPCYQEGTVFQQKVWTALTAIPYGRTITYLELSKRIGDSKAIRAVGTANGGNAISIIVPCHRVIGSSGDLTGYSGGLWRKKWLLDHEGKYSNGVQTLF